MKWFKQSPQMKAESLEVGILLAFAGGFIDIYSYMGRGGVFANAQNGNLIFLALHLFKFNWLEVLKYLLPIISYSIGTALAEHFHHPKYRFFKWRQIPLMFEIITLFFVAFFPSSWNYIANMLTSMACGIQSVTFKKVHGLSMQTISVQGELRDGVQYITSFLHTKNREEVQTSLLYFFILLCFVLGAVVGDALLYLFGLYTIWFAAGIMLIIFFLLFKD